MTEQGKILTDDEASAGAALQRELLAYLHGQGASADTMASSAYVQAITAFCAGQAALELLRDLGLASPEALSRRIADQYLRMAAKVRHESRLVQIVQGARQ